MQVIRCLLVAGLVIGVFHGCSAGGSDSGATVQTGGSNGGPILLPDTNGQGSDDPDVILNDDGQAIDANGNPVNIGTELACDGIDENENGVIDDVDAGKDGLCDCLRIGFLGALASDAGNATGAFEAWLEERSAIPITHIGARDPLTAETLAGLQVLVVGNMAERSAMGGYSAAEIEVMRQWVEAGGGLMTLSGYTNREADAAPAAALLAPLGMGYDYQGRGAGILGMGAPPVIVRGIVNAAHPTLEGIAALGVYYAYPVTGDGEVIVREGTFDLAMAKVVGEGHAFVFSDEWITQDALWLPMTNRPLTPCQQGCNQCDMQCASCEQQCADCQLQPCEGGQQPAEGEACRRGCDQGCAACTTACTGCEGVCAACSATEEMAALDIPRFWLNVMRWLTPANECQVPIPPRIIF